MKVYKFFLLVFSTCTILSCQTDDLFPRQMSLKERLNSSEVTGFEEIRNVSYGSSSFQKFDLVKPKFSGDSVASAVMIMIHGGGWSMLDKVFMNPHVDLLKKQNVNLAIVNMNHRLAGIDGASYAEIMEDYDLLIEHLQKNKGLYNLSSDLILYGYSSGGHLAIEYSKRSAASFEVKAVSAIAPPVDLTDPYLVENLRDKRNRKLTELFVGETFGENIEPFKIASPVFKISNISKPSILFHAENDQYISKEQMLKISTLLRDKRISNELIEFKGVSHEFENRLPEIVDHTMRFLQRR